MKRVVPNSIETWLGDNKCLLLIDELNQIPHLVDKGNETAKEFAFFLKKNFLSSKGRYFVFSSHIPSTGDQLSRYLDAQAQGVCL
jgi:hypothetical protein